MGKGHRCPGTQRSFPSDVLGDKRRRCRVSPPRGPDPPQAEPVSLEQKPSARHSPSLGTHPVSARSRLQDAVGADQARPALQSVVGLVNPMIVPKLSKSSCEQCCEGDWLVPQQRVRGT